MMLVPVDVGDIAPPSISDRPVPLPECSSTKTIRPTDETAQTMRARTRSTSSRRTPQVLVWSAACRGQGPRHGESV